MTDNRPPRPATLALKLIAARIDAHLKRFEADPVINAPKVGASVRVVPYFRAQAVPRGSRVHVTYVNYQGGRYLTRREAEKYLEWLDAGNVGKHFVALGRPHT